MESINAIIEGDSYSAIQWGSGAAFIPQRLLDWVEEVQDISRRLGASFRCIFREANVMANAFAKEGVFRTSIFFMLIFVFGLLGVSCCSPLFFSPLEQ